MYTDIPGVHSELLPDTLAALDRLESRYPGIPFTISCVSPFAMTTDPDATAETEAWSGNIRLNSLFFSNPGFFWMGVNEGTTVTKSPGDIVRHEWGHVLSKWAPRKDLAEAIRRISDIALPFLLSLPPDTDLENLAFTNIDLARTFPISFYAITGGPMETLAECTTKLERGDNDEYAEIADIAFRSLRRA